MAGAVAVKSRDAIFAANRAVGSIALSVKTVGGKTRRDHVHEAGALRVRCPGSPARELEAVIINTAGGGAGGDRLDFHFTAAGRARPPAHTGAGGKGDCTLPSATQNCVSPEVSGGPTLRRPLTAR